MTPRDRRTLALAGLGALAVRLAVIAATPDVETDAYGHFKIGRALVADPTNLHVHWVWLPGYHYVVWALLHVGIGFTSLRVLNAVIQALAPVVLYDLVARRGGDDLERSREAALLAALGLTVAPLANRLATSAQAETLFALLVLGSAWAVERRRAWLAGGLLAAACLVRYEAGGAVPALSAGWLLRRGRPAAVAAPSFVLPAAAIAAWILVRRAADGEWLTFLRYTQAFASGVREAQALPPLFDRLLLPVLLPPVVLGPAIALVPLGIRRSVRVGWLVPAGVLGFLLASYAGRGALGLERYFTALVPFGCVAVADGALRLPEIARGVSARAAARGAIVALALTTAGHLAWIVHRARAREAELRGYEAAAMGEATR
jgi:hypothetical protein